MRQYMGVAKSFQRGRGNAGYRGNVHSLFDPFAIRVLRFIRFVYCSSQFISVKLDFCIV